MWTSFTWVSTGTPSSPEVPLLTTGALVEARLRLVSFLSIKSFNWLSWRRATEGAGAALEIPRMQTRSEMASKNLACILVNKIWKEMVCVESTNDPFYTFSNQTIHSSAAYSYSRPQWALKKCNSQWTSSTIYMQGSLHTHGCVG